MSATETLEQAGSRYLQALLINPNDGLAMFNMMKYFTSSVETDPKTCNTISEALDRVGRSLCAASMQSQALISARDDGDKVRFGIASMSRMNRVYTKGYNGIEDVGYWKHHILRPERQMDLVLTSYTRLLGENPMMLHDYSQILMVELRNIWRAQHLEHLKNIYTALKIGGAETQGKANLLMSEVVELKKSLT